MLIKKCENKLNEDDKTLYIRDNRKSNHSL